MVIGTPDAEVEIDEPLVRKLLREQHPDLADEPIAPADAGWDNATFRLGQRDAVRLPRRQLGAALIEIEQRWLPLIGRPLPIPTPVPKRTGKPSADYPWRWSIVPWLPGRTSNLAPPAASQAALFAEFLLALHQPAAADAPHNEFRGMPLQQKAEAMQQRLNRLEMKQRKGGAEILRIWEQALEAPAATETRWLHGDLHARNVLTKDGVISGVIDWGDMTAGDVATDLAAVWSLFDQPHARAECLRRYAASPAEAARAKGWAVIFAAMLLESGLVDSPAHAAMGEAIFRRLHDDAESHQQ